MLAVSSQILPKKSDEFWKRSEEDKNAWPAFKVAVNVHIFRSVIKEATESNSAKGCRSGQNDIYRPQFRKHREIQDLECVVNAIIGILSFRIIYKEG